MDKKQRRMMLIIFGVIAAVLILGIVLTAGNAGEEEDIQTVMRDAVLHDTFRVNIFGMEVNPGLIAAFTVTGVLALFALIVRVFVIPRFTMVPGKFQMLLETLVGFFDNLAKSNSPHLNGILGGYVFAAGV